MFITRHHRGIPLRISAPFTFELRSVSIECLAGKRSDYFDWAIEYQFTTCHWLRRDCNINLDNKQLIIH
jgi:hypothetical protein